MSTFNNLDFVSSEYWPEYNDDPADHPRKQKPLAEQVAKTQRGRVMQMLAEEYCDATARAPLYNEEQEEFLDLLEAFQNGEIDHKGLRTLKNKLEAVEVKSSTHETQWATISPILSKIDERLTAIELPGKLATDLAVFQKIREKTGEAIKNKNWKKVHELNQHVLKIIHQIKAALDILRHTTPDRLYGIAKEMWEIDPNMVNPYKSIIIEYVATHNSFQFSSELLEEVRDLCTDEKRGRFPNALHQAYSNRPKTDDVFGFIEKTTRIPSHRLMAVLRNAT